MIVLAAPDLAHPYHLDFRGTHYAAMGLDYPVAAERQSLLPQHIPQLVEVVTQACEWALVHEIESIFCSLQESHPP